MSFLGPSLCMGNYIVQDFSHRWYMYDVHCTLYKHCKRQQQASLEAIHASYDERSLLIDFGVIVTKERRHTIHRSLPSPLSSWIMIIIILVIINMVTMLQRECRAGRSSPQAVESWSSLAGGCACSGNTLTPKCSLGSLLCQHQTHLTQLITHTIHAIQLSKHDSTITFVSREFIILAKIVIMRMMKDMKVPATYVGGLICLCTYYRALHPKGRMPNPAHTAKIL